MAERLTHLDEAGQARMVDVSGKDVTARTARASGRVLLSAAAVAALREGRMPKGDALAVARIAGIQGAKRTPDLIPLCHPIGLHSVTVDLSVQDEGVLITATTRTADRTGVEMEALTAVSVAALAPIPIGLHSVTVDLSVQDEGVLITATTRTADRTGVEMEALTAVSVAALALIDMVKAVDPAAVIADVRVEEKTGGKTGRWTRP